MAQPLLRYGLIHLTTRTYAVCIQSSKCSYNGGVGAGFTSYSLVTKPLKYAQAIETLRIIANGGKFGAEHESWFPDDLPLDRRNLPPFQTDPAS